MFSLLKERDQVQGSRFKVQNEILLITRLRSSTTFWASTRQADYWSLITWFYWQDLMVLSA